MSERSPSGPTPPPPDDLTFEAALDRLEGIVGTLEQGDLALEAALAAFEQGVRLSRRCAAQLDQAERRIEELVREGDGQQNAPNARNAPNGVDVRPFEGPEEGGS